MSKNSARQKVHQKIKDIEVTILKKRKDREKLEKKDILKGDKYYRRIENLNGGKGGGSCGSEENYRFGF
jgi:hypothetical protein